MTTLSLVPLDKEGYNPHVEASVQNEEKTDSIREGEGEETKTWFRSERIHEDVNGAWFFVTREKVDVGPYSSLREAEIDVQVLIAELKKAESTEEALEIIEKFNTREKLRLL
jgi:hypothetical protein